MSGPWSPAELEEKVAESLERLETAVTDLKAMGERSARAKWKYEEAWAICLAGASGKNTAERNAEAIRALGAMVDKHGVHPGLAKDLSANAYSNQRSVISAIQYELDAYRTMLVSHRNVA